MRIWRGSPYPLGATWDGAGVNFALFSEHATQVELCLFDSAERRARKPSGSAAGADVSGMARLLSRSAARAALWLSRPRAVRAARPGTASIRNKLLLDPYAKAIGRDLTWDDSLFGYKVGGGGRRPGSRRPRQRARSRRWPQVVDTAFTWGNDQLPETPWEKTIIYELHVKGFTKLMPGVPEPSCAGRMPAWPARRRSST